MLYEFIDLHREEIITRCRAKVATRTVPPPTPTEVNNGVPVFLDQLSEALRLGQTSSPQIGLSAIKHGRDLLQRGFTVSQVVHDYGDICQAVTELAVELNLPISTDDFRTLNACLDDAIAGAVTEYGRARIQSGIDGESARGGERLGFFAHELRNLMNTAILAFEVLKTGNVGVAGSTGAVLQRSLASARLLITRSLEEVRLTQGVRHREPFLLSPFIEQISQGWGLDADARGVTLKVLPVDAEVAIDADRQVLDAVVGNLLQNAFKFTRPGTTVTLTVGASTDRVLIEIQDECGGLTGGSLEELFRPFDQRGADRTGLGLGLAYARWGAEANGGRVYARTTDGRGCVFTIDLPRLHVPAAHYD